LCPKKALPPSIRRKCPLDSVPRFELTEAARERTQTPSFVTDLFMGAAISRSSCRSRSKRMRTATRATHSCNDSKKILREQADPDAIDRAGEIPDAVIDALADIGAFAIKVPAQYGGLGLSQTNYCRAAMLLGGYCGNLTALVSAHQSIGVPQPLLLFGTEEQKRKYLPRFARGEISAFALTENGVGSDPARMQTQAEPTPMAKLSCSMGKSFGAPTAPAPA
jgi:alkylation response protein AidB-like acyl-CoA dehydrogenase